MADVINCPSCHRKLQVPESLIGHDVQCPSCGATFVARIGGQVSPPSTPPQQPLSAWDAGQRKESPRPPQNMPPVHDDFDSDHRSRRGDQTPHRGPLILTLGLVGIVIWPVAPIAWIMGTSDLQEIQAGHMDPEGEGQVHAGKVCGIIGSILGCMGGCLTCLCCGIPFLNSLGR